MLDSYAGVAIQLAGTVVMARLLTPQEMGTFAVAAVFGGIAASVRNFGVSEFLIQERTLDMQTVRATNGVVLLVSWSLGLAINLLAGPVARFYGVAEVATLLHVLSISFFLTPFAAVPLAHFRRELRMLPTFVANGASNLTALVVGIWLALRGHGPMSLAWSTVAGVAAAVSVAVLFKPATLSLRPSLVGAARVFGYGKHVSGVYAFGQIGAGAPEAVIGKAADMPSVAHYSRANGLIELFNKLVLHSIWPVVMPFLAKHTRAAGGVRWAYLTGSSYLTAIAWPILFLMGLLAFPAIRIVYGDQWLDSVPLAQVLCIAAALSVTYHLTKDTLLAAGRARECNVLQLQVHALRIGGVVLGIPFGLAGASWGIVVGTLCGLALTHRALHAATGLKFAEVAASLLPSLRVAVLSVLPAAVLVAIFPPDAGNYFAIGVSAALLALGAWCWFMSRDAHPLWAEIGKLPRRPRRR